MTTDSAPRALDLSPRMLALDLLSAVLRRRRALDDEFEALIGRSTLEPRDRGFVRLVVATVLRRLGQIDAALAAALAKPELPKPEVHDLLRLGAAQLLFLDTPAHAAVNTTVELAGASAVTKAYKPLINAVMRRLGREGAAKLAGPDAARLNTPDRLWSSWQAAYGAETAWAITTAHLHEAPLDLTLKDPADAPRLAEALDAAILPTGSLRRAAGGSVVDLPGFVEGSWWVQDAAAALPARLLGDIRNRLVFDLCAAPGGKTAQLAAAGAQTIAIDRAGKRLERLHANLQRLGLSAEIVTADATVWQPEQAADAILLDAPCSASGTIRRHPDIPHLKGPDDIAKLSVLQRRLLERAVDLLRPGGVLVYTVCSLQPEESERQIAALLAAGHPVERVPIAADEIGGLAEAITAAGDLRTLPCHLTELGGMDGFYACRLRKN
ncbi:MAG: transcription antitermination factor NusB [Rhodospirillaceae bacterium]